MWAYESVFYQIYPLGFCGAPFENDGILEHRILKVNDWIPHIQKLGANAINFSPVTLTDIIQEIIQRLTQDWERMRTLNLCVIICIRQESKLYWMAYLIMWDVDSGRSRMC